MKNYDCHIHLALDGINYKESIKRHKDGLNYNYIEKTLEKYKDAGITFIRDGGDKYGVGLYASTIAEGYGIEYLSPAFPIFKNGYYGKFIGKGFDNNREYKSLINEAKKSGASFIKLMLSGIIDFSSYGKMSCEDLPEKEIKELVNIAMGEGFPVMAHCNGMKSCMAAIEAGVASLEHGFFIEDEAFFAMKEMNCVYVPTISPIGNLIGDDSYPQNIIQALLDGKYSDIEKAKTIGCSIALGSDSGSHNVPLVTGTNDEYLYLSKVLGIDTDEILYKGLEQIKINFTKR